MKNIDSNPDFWRKIKFNLNIKQNEDVIQNDDEEEESNSKIFLLSNHAAKKKF